MNIPAQTLSLTILTLVFSFPALASGELDIEDAWIAEAPPVSKVMAAYMKIENESDRDHQITAMQCEAFARAEFHRTIEKDGMASMEHQHTLDIAAGSELVLKPGGYHIMLFNPARRLYSGDKTGCSMTLENGTRINIDLVVKKSSVEEHSHHHH